MRDNEGRVIDYLRISITDRCNLRCIYCMPEEGVKNICHEEILSYDEITRICSVLAGHGLKKIKITGGEPLVRKDVIVLIRKLKKIPGITSVTLTTNGVLLEQYYDALIDAGIDTITVSLDTMKRNVYQQITRRDELERVLRGIEKAIRENRVRLKINCVCVAGIDTQNVLALLDYAQRADVDIRFIEMMPIGLGKQFSFVSEAVVRKMIEEKYGKLTPYGKTRGNGPCKYYDVPGFIGKVGFISAVSHRFCDTCNRVRLTSDGFLKSCLQYDHGVYLKSLLEQKVSDEILWETMTTAIKQKPKAHHFDEKKIKNEDEIRGMSQIGG